MTRAEEIDYVELALRTDRDMFVSSYPLLFLFGVDHVRRPALDGASGHGDGAPGDAAAAVDPARGSSRPPLWMWVLPLRKSQPAFPDMLSVGRTPNNDIVLPDTSVSTFHAHFRVPRGGVGASSHGLELTDAGSSLGTYVDDRRIAAKESLFVEVGQQVRFGNVELRLLDSVKVWHRVRSLLLP